MNIKEHAYKLSKEGMSYAKIAAIIGTVKSTAHDYVKEIERRLSGNTMSTSKVRSSRKKKEPKVKLSKDNVVSNDIQQEDQSLLVNNDTPAIHIPDSSNILPLPQNTLNFKVAPLNITPQSKKEADEFIQKYKNKSRDENLALLAESLKGMTKKQGIIAASAFGAGVLLFKLLSPKKVDKENPKDKQEETKQEEQSK